MKYSTYHLVPALFVLLIVAITYRATTLPILAHPAVESSLNQPSDGSQNDGNGEVFHSCASTSHANSSQGLSNARGEL